MLLATSVVFADPSAPSPDFSPGFEKLVALGMAPLGPDAVWSASRETAGNSYQFRELSRTLKGNSWSVPAADGKFRQLPMASADFVDGLQVKPPKAADLAKDVELMINGLSKAAEEARKRDMFSSSPDFPAGSVLLFAAQIHQTGRKDLANQLARAVFQSVPNREEVVDLAVSSLADASYQKVVGTFFGNGDWVALKRSLEDLLQRYPRGWKNGAAVTLMLPQLTKQAAGEKPAPPALKDVELDPEVVELTLRLLDQAQEKPEEKPRSGLSARERAMLEYRRERGFSPPDLWLLKPAAAEDEEKPEDDENPFVEITRLRMKAIPVLAALADDPVFTHFPNQSSGYSSYFSSHESEESRILRAYQQLYRPLTRGEIASKLLAATLPDGENQLSEADGTILRDAAISFWKEHRNDSDSQLAACFLSTGDEQQSSTAGQLLAKSTNPEDHKLFEKHVLASEDAIQLFQSVQIYLRTRKSAAKPFFDEYAKLVRSQNVGDGQEESNRHSWMIREAGGAEKILKQMEGLVGGQSPKAVAVQVAKGDPKEAAQAIRALQTTIAELSPVKRLYVMLEGANAAKDAGIRSRFLEATLMQFANPRTVEEAGDPPPPDRKLIDAEVAVWRKLMADDRPIPPEVLDRMQSMGARSVGELAAVALEFSVSPNCQFRAYRAAVIAGQTASEFLRARAQARLAGQSIPDFPNPSRVPAERLKAIVAEAGTKDEASIPPYLLTLSQDERAAWVEWLGEAESAAVPEPVRNLRLRVVRSAKESPYDLPMLDDLGPIKSGFTVSVESVRAHVESLAKNLEKHSRGYIEIHSVGFGPGLESSGVRLPMPAKPENGDDEEEADGFAVNRSVDIRSVMNDVISAFEEHESADGLILVEANFENSEGAGLMWIVKNGSVSPLNPEALSVFEENFKQGLAWESGDFEISWKILSKNDALKLTSEDSADTLDLLPPP
jgi:hypothetical protein